MDFTKCSRFDKYCCSFFKFTYFWSNFVRYGFIAICLLNPKQHRISEKSSMQGDVADSAYNSQNAQLGLVMIILILEQHAFHHLLFKKKTSFYAHKYIKIHNRRKTNTKNHNKIRTTTNHNKYKEPQQRTTTKNHNTLLLSTPLLSSYNSEDI